MQGEMMKGEMMHGKTCSCPHHKLIPTLIIFFALLFLLGAFGVVTERFVSIAWPIIVGVAGFFKLIEDKCKCNR